MAFIKCKFKNCYSCFLLLFQPFSYKIKHRFRNPHTVNTQLNELAKSQDLSTHQLGQQTELCQPPPKPLDVSHPGQCAFLFTKVTTTLVFICSFITCVYIPRFYSVAVPIGKLDMSFKSLIFHRSPTPSLSFGYGFSGNLTCRPPTTGTSWLFIRGAVHPVPLSFYISRGLVNLKFDLLARF